jgi:hypothetical protein
MATSQGGVELLEDPVAQELLQTGWLARLSYTWTDGTPRVVPIGFHWNGSEVVMVTGQHAPKMRALKDGSRVAVTIDTEEFPNKVLLLRGPVTIESSDGLSEEWIAYTRRGLGEESAEQFVGLAQAFPAEYQPNQKIRLRPDWVGIIDFQTRFPSAFARAMAAMSE